MFLRVEQEWTDDLGSPNGVRTRVSTLRGAFRLSRGEQAHPGLCCRACSAGESGPNPSWFVLDLPPGVLPNRCQAVGWRNTPRT
jgi:hypothetical protein